MKVSPYSFSQGCWVSRFFCKIRSGNVSRWRHRRRGESSNLERSAWHVTVNEGWRWDVPRRGRLRHCDNQTREPRTRMCSQIGVWHHPAWGHGMFHLFISFNSNHSRSHRIMSLIVIDQWRGYCFGYVPACVDRCHELVLHRTCFGYFFAHITWLSGFLSFQSKSISSQKLRDTRKNNPTRK